MKKIKKTLCFSGLLVLLILTGCSAMPATQSGFLSQSDHISTKPLQHKKIEVFWRAGTSDKINMEEQKSLTALLETELQQAMTKTAKDNGRSLPQYPDTNTIQIRAAITRVEPVSPAINVLTALLLFVPLDHGGAAVEMEAVDLATNKVITQLNFAKWTPLYEIPAHFNRLAPAKLALASAAEEFLQQLKAQQGGKWKGG